MISGNIPKINQRAAFGTTPLRPVASSVKEKGRRNRSDASSTSSFPRKRESR